MRSVLISDWNISKQSEVECEGDASLDRWVKLIMWLTLS